MRIVDTDVLSFIWRHHPRGREYYRMYLSGHTPAISSVTRDEMRSGAVLMGWSRARRSRLEHMLLGFRVIPVTDNVTRVAEWLRSVAPRGLHINDSLIAATARVGTALVATAQGEPLSVEELLERGQDFPLVSNNYRDFEQLAPFGLRLLNLPP